MTRAPLWTAAHEGHDWRDEEVLAGLSWLTDRLDPRRWSERLERTRTTFEEARRHWAGGERVSASAEAARRKATHFRQIVAGAAGQLPGDRPGVVHVGYELLGGNGADARRDLLNRIEMMRFDPSASRLAWFAVIPAASLV